MKYYFGATRPLNQSSLNLFCLRYDLHYGQFNQGNFVIIPKLGKLVVHFLRRGRESPCNYHNVVFDHKGTLSYHALYARFAWALMKIVNESQLDSKQFKFLGKDGDDEKDPKSGWSGKRGAGSGKRGGGSGDQDKGEGGSGGGEDASKTRKRRRNDWDGDVECDSDTSSLHPDESSLEADTLDEADMRNVARDLPFLGAHEPNPFEYALTTLIQVDPTIKPTPQQYESVIWYPGIEAVERRKKEYFDRHQNIRAHRVPPQSNSTAYYGDCSSAKF